MSGQWDKEVEELQKAYAEENKAEHGRLVRAMSEALAQSGALGVVGGCLEPSASRSPVFVVKAWGDEIPHATEQAALDEISECLQLGARSVSVEVRESPAPYKHRGETRSGERGRGPERWTEPRKPLSPERCFSTA